MKVRLQTAIRNAIKVQESPDGQKLPISVPPNRKKNVFRRLRKSLKKRIRRLADKVRRYLIKGVRIKLDGLAAQINDTNVRLDSVQTRLDDIGLKVRVPLAIDEASYAVRAIDGYISVPRADAALLLMLSDAPAGGPEPGTRSVLLRVLTVGMTTVDVGANVGLLTLPIARKVGPPGRVYAFEPTPTTFEHLKRTIAFNGLGDIVVAQQLAIGAGAERRKLFLHTTSGHNSFYPQSGSHMEEAVDVEVNSLDALIPPDAPVNLVKIDVEGAELDVLAGMTRIANANPDIIVVAEFGLSHLRRTNVSPDQWFRAFGKFGFSAYAINELTGKCRPINYREVMDTTSINIAFARPSEAYRLL